MRPPVLLMLWTNVIYLQSLLAWRWHLTSYRQWRNIVVSWQLLCRHHVSMAGDSKQHFNKYFSRKYFSVTFTYIFHVRVLVRDVPDEKLMKKLDNSSSDSKWWYWCCSECCSCTALLWCRKADYNHSNNMAILHFICPIVYIFQWMTGRLSLHCLSLFKMLSVLYWSVLKLCWEYIIVPTHHIQSVIDLCHGHQPIDTFYYYGQVWKYVIRSDRSTLSYSYRPSII